MKSELAWKRLRSVLAGGVNSPVRACMQMGITPLIVEKAFGPFLEDVDGKKYIDFCSSWGALLFGHADPKIQEAVVKALGRGTSYGASTLQEAVLGEKVRHFFPTIERIRFVSSGTEATMSAVRLARGYTKKNRILVFEGNYHGHSDQFLKSAGSGVAYTSGVSGVPAVFNSCTDRIAYNDMDALKRYFSSEMASDCAAVILEPVAINMGCILPKSGFLELLRQETKKRGILLIFDEVVTGFRLAPGGAQEHFGIKPDLTCLGKILGGGFPIAAFGGRVDIMECLAPLGPVYQAGTLSGNPIATAAGIQVLDMINPGIYQDLERKTKRLFEPVEKLVQKKKLPVSVARIGSMGTIFFSPQKVETFEDAKKCSQELFREFFVRLLNKGIYIPPLQLETWFVSTAHTDEMIDEASTAIIDTLLSLSWLSLSA